MGVLGSIFGFGDSLKRRLRDAVSNPSDYAQMTADQNQNEWSRNPDERSMGFFNPAPLGTMRNFAFRKELADALPNLSRRDFMKKSAGLAGGTAAAAIPGAKLLSKFAPEEKTALKEANVAKQIAVESAPKYKYHSLKEYLDDVESKVYSRYDDAVPSSFMSNKDQMKDILLNDELAYNNAKWAKKNADKYPHEYQPRDRETLNMFSPQAKKEMKAWKEMRGKGWENIDEYSRGEIGRGLFPNHNGSLVKNPANDTYHHYLPGQEGRLSDGFSSLDEASEAMTRTLQEAFRNKTRTGF